MAFCPTCSNPTQDSWKVCAVCGTALNAWSVGEPAREKPNRRRLWMIVAISSAAALVLVAAGVIGFLVLSSGSSPIKNPETMSEDGQLGEPEESPEPEQTSVAQEISDKLINEGICTSAWSLEDYSNSPILGIDKNFWVSGDVRVCKVDRTTKSTTRWITIISGDSLLRKFGSGWDVEDGSIAIHSNDWTLVMDTILTGNPVRDDPVVQSILLKLGGEPALPRK